MNYKIVATDKSLLDEIRKKITEEYTGVYPDLKEKFSVRICSSADGVGYSE